MIYPTRCRIIDVTGQEVFPGIEGRTPDESKPHVGKAGLAEEVGDNVRITLDDGTVIWGYDCWWKPLAELDAQVAIIIGWTAPSNKLPESGWEEVGSRMVHTDGLTLHRGHYISDQWWQAPDRTYHEHPPAYSSDWAAFGELWEHLQADPSIDLMKVIYVSDEHEARVNESYGHGTFHEAFCRAALAAVRARKENDG